METRTTRVFCQLEELAGQGWLSWPPNGDTPSAPSPEHKDEPLFANVRRPLLDLGEDELAETLRALAELARDEGIFALETVLSADSGSLLTEALLHVVDGTEPDLVEDLLETRGGTILRRRTVRGHMAIEGWMSIQALDNPAIVRVKVGTLFLDEVSLEPYEYCEPAVDELVARLKKEPWSRMEESHIGEFYRDMAFVARQRGFDALAPLMAAADDEVLVAGMRSTLDDDSTPDKILAAMTDQLQDLRVRLKRRESMVIAGGGPYRWAGRRRKRSRTLAPRPKSREQNCWKRAFRRRTSEGLRFPLVGGGVERRPGAVRFAAVPRVVGEEQAVLLRHRHEHLQGRIDELPADAVALEGLEHAVFVTHGRVVEIGLVVGQDPTPVAARR